MRRQEAFTLVELLVALTITVILVLLLTSIVAATLGAWALGRNRLDTFSTARQVIGRLNDELKGATANPSVGGSQLEFIENSSLGGVPAPHPGTAESVFFVAPYPNVGAGDLCTIAYALDSGTHELKRAFRSSDQVWSDPAASRYQATGYSYVAGDWKPVAAGVLEFELQCYSQNDLDMNIDPPALTWNSENNGDPNMLGEAPRRIVIRLTVVDDRAAGPLRSLTPGSTAYNNIVNRSARQFTSDVSLPPP